MGKKGKVIFNDFIKKAEFDVSEDCITELWRKVSRLCHGDIITFSIERTSDYEYIFSLLEIEDEKDCAYGINDLAYIISNNDKQN